MQSLFFLLLLFIPLCPIENMHLQCLYMINGRRTSTLSFLKRVYLLHHQETNEASLAFAILRGRVKRVLQKEGNSSSLWVKWLRSGDIGCTITIIKRGLLDYCPPPPPFIYVALSSQISALMLFNSLR